MARQAVDEAISKSFTLKDFDRQLSEMGYRINFDPNRKYWTIICKGWERPKRLYKLGEDYTNERILERIKENSYAVKFQSFSKEQPQVRVYRVRGSLKDAKKIGGLRGLYLHYCYKLGILPKRKKQNPARFHYLLKDDLMKMEAITDETRLLCATISTRRSSFCPIKALWKSEMQELTEQRKGLYSTPENPSGRKRSGQGSAVGNHGGMKTLRKEVRLCEGIEAAANASRKN